MLAVIILCTYSFQFKTCLNVVVFNSEEDPSLRVSSLDILVDLPCICLTLLPESFKTRKGQKERGSVE